MADSYVPPKGVQEAGRRGDAPIPADETIAYKPVKNNIIETPEVTMVGPSINEVRSVSSSGGEKGVKPERFSLIPKAPLDLLARIYRFGEGKYAPHNYRKGYEWSKSYDALQRHLTAWWERDEIDEESGLSHLGHAAWHIFALIVFSSEERYKQFDDRYIHPDHEVAPVVRNERTVVNVSGIMSPKEVFATMDQVIDNKDLPDSWHDVGPTPEPTKCWIILDKETDFYNHWRCNAHSNKSFKTKRGEARPEKCSAV